MKRESWMMCEMRDDKGILQNKQKISLLNPPSIQHMLLTSRGVQQKICNLFYFLIYSVTKPLCCSGRAELFKKSLSPPFQSCHYYYILLSNDAPFPLFLPSREGK